jgi:hypothetical protein
MRQEINNDELTAEELAALGDSEEPEEKPDVGLIDLASGISEKGKKASASLEQWRKRVKRGREADVNLLAQIESLREQAKLSLPLNDIRRTMAEEMIHHAGAIHRALNYWKASSQKIPVSEMFDHVNQQREKSYDKQVYMCFYMDSACRQILLNAAEVPMTPDLKQFVLRALERGVQWMKEHPDGVDGLQEIAEELEKLGGTKGVAISPQVTATELPVQETKHLRKPKVVVKPTAEWIRVATKLGHVADVERRVKEYDQYKLDLEEYKRCVKQRRKERKDLI